MSLNESDLTLWLPDLYNHQLIYFSWKYILYFRSREDYDEIVSQQSINSTYCLAIMIEKFATAHCLAIVRYKSVFEKHNQHFSADQLIDSATDFWLPLFSQAFMGFWVPALKRVESDDPFLLNKKYTISHHSMIKNRIFILASYGGLFNILFRVVGFRGIEIIVKAVMRFLRGS